MLAVTQTFYSLSQLAVVCNKHKVRQYPASFIKGGVVVYILNPVIGV